MEVTERLQDDVLVLAISGRVSFYSRKIFQAIMNNVQNSQATHVVLNLAEVTFIDSVALGLLVLAYTNMALQHVEMSLVEPSASVREILEMANVPQLIPIYSSEEQAILHCSAPTYCSP